MVGGSRRSMMSRTNFSTEWAFSLRLGWSLWKDKNSSLHFGKISLFFFLLLLLSLSLCVCVCVVFVYSATKLGRWRETSTMKRVRCRNRCEGKSSCWRRYCKTKMEGMCELAVETKSLLLFSTNDLVYCRSHVHKFPFRVFMYKSIFSVDSDEIHLECEKGSMEHHDISITNHSALPTQIQLEAKQNLSVWVASWSRCLQGV